MQHQHDFNGNSWVSSLHHGNIFMLTKTALIYTFWFSCICNNRKAEFSIHFTLPERIIKIGHFVFFLSMSYGFYSECEFEQFQKTVQKKTVVQILSCQHNPHYFLSIMINRTFLNVFFPVSVSLESLFLYVSVGATV